MVRNYCLLLYLFFFFKQKTAYEMRISDWSSDVCSSDLAGDTAIAALEDHALPHGIDPRHRRAALAPLLDREDHVLFRPQRLDGGDAVGGVGGELLLAIFRRLILQVLGDEIGRGSCRARVC